MSAIEKVHQLISRHVVTLTWTDRDVHAPDQTGSDRTFCLSASVISIEGRWFLLTAGHVLEALDQTLKEGTLIYAGLYGNWGPATGDNGKITFNYEDTRRWWLRDDEAGFDYGLISLGDYYAAHLRAIHVQPLTEEYWLEVPKILARYVLVGFPSERVRVEQMPGTSNSVTTSVSMANALVRLEAVEDPPDELRTNNLRFYARLVAPEQSTDSEFSIRDIDGMSGGPVFGFGADPNGVIRYWIVGVQSGWHRPTRVIAACPVAQVFSNLRAKYIEFDSGAPKP